MYQAIHECMKRLLMQPIVNFCRFNEFGNDGGPAARQLRPKFNVFSKHVATHTGFQIPHIEVRRVFIYSQFIDETRLCTHSQRHIYMRWHEFIDWGNCLFQMKHLILGAIIMKSLGSLLFVFSSSFGAVILVPTTNPSSIYIYIYIIYELNHCCLKFFCILSYSIKLFQPLSCMTSTTTKLTKRNLFSSSSSSLRFAFNLWTMCTTKQMSVSEFIMWLVTTHHAAFIIHFWH